MGRLRIYLSPSKQPGNFYASGNTNEQKEMEEVAKTVKKILDEEYDCESILATLTLGLGSEGRAKEAKEKACDVYMAIHSNAGGNGKASGAVAFYHKAWKESHILAEHLVRELNGCCPHPTNRKMDIIDGMEAFEGKGYGEIRVPAMLGMIPVLAETNFHDNPVVAAWMIHSKATIARAYVEALVKAFNINRKASEIIKITGSTAEDKRFYRVQVGAFGKKENAELMLKKLQDLGIDAYVRYS
ncbi:MAG: N-acetylmuramoyl-L-alanine amidase [Clostridiaceae bacterium]